MLNRIMIATVVVTSLLSLASRATHAADWGLKEGDVSLSSGDRLAFGPDNILLIGDAKTATIYAIDTEDNVGNAATARITVDHLQSDVVKAVGMKGSIAIKDIAVNPNTGNAFISVSIEDKVFLLKVTGNEVSKHSLSSVKMAKTTLPNVPEDKVVGSGRRKGNKRLESITYLAYHENKVYVSGLTNKKTPSSLREVPFPFVGEAAEANIEFYHGAHGRSEDYPAARAFVPFVIDGEPNLLAGFTCTPLVRFPVKDIKNKLKITGTTVAELGNRNRPLDMIVYKQGGKNFLLIANSARGVMKVSTDDIDRDEGITSRVSGGGLAGQKYQTVKSLEGTTQLAKMNDKHALVLIGSVLKTVPLP